MTLAIFNETSAWSLPSRLVAEVEEAAGSEVEVRATGSRADLAAALPETTYLAGLPLTEEQLSQQAPKLQWLALTSSLGDEESLLMPALRSGVRVTTAGSARAPQVADHAMALLLALSRRIDSAVAAQSDQRWVQQELPGQMRSLHGARVGVVGPAGLSVQVARRAVGFGCRTLGCCLGATDVQPSSEPGLDDVRPLIDLREVLSRSDVLIVCLPRTSSTIGLIGKAEIAELPKGAILIDTGRGGVVQEPPLLDALRKGRLSGAGLDVFSSEPLAPNSPLWTTPGVIITPHVAGAGPRYWEHAVEALCENLRRVRDGRPLCDEATAEWYRPRPR